VGLRPMRLFDTELGGRLVGLPRVGLAAVVEHYLGLSLAKEHSAVDWSTRPLPEPWLRYAALDVEILVDLRDALEGELARQGKLTWAREEFETVLAAEPAAPRVDPWRRTSGIHRLRNRRQLAIVRALWTERDALARERDVAPGRLLPDSAIVAAAAAAPTAPDALGRLPGWGGKATRRLVAVMWPAVQAALAEPDQGLPAPSLPGDGPPPASRWPDRDPVAAARLARARAEITAIATEHGLPVENLLSPELVRRVAWTPPDPPTPVALAAALRDGGAREWQVSLTGDALARAFAAPVDGPGAGPADVPVDAPGVDAAGDTRR
jgi:ribonuclease D